MGRAIPPVLHIRSDRGKPRIRGESQVCGQSRRHRPRRGGGDSPICNGFPNPSRTSLVESKPYSNRSAIQAFLRYYCPTQKTNDRRKHFMGLLRIARTPLVTVRPESTVMQAVKLMDQESIGAVTVMDGNDLLGIFSERDLMLRVISERKDPERTLVQDVMTSPVETIHRDCLCDEALKMM